MGELIAPGTIGLAVLLHIADEVLQVGALMIPGAFIMHIPKGPLNRIGPRTIGWEEQQLHTGMTGEPLRNCLGFMNTTVIDDDIQASVLGGRIALLKDGEQRAEQGIGFASAEAVPEGPGGDIERPAQLVLRILPRRHHGDLRALRHPHCSHFG